MSTTINGLASIRAYGAQKSFEEQFYTYQNDHSATWFIFISSSRAIGLIMDWISTLYIFIITVSVMLSTGMLNCLTEFVLIIVFFYQGLPGGDAGLAISSGLLLAGIYIKLPLIYFQSFYTFI